MESITERLDTPKNDYSKAIYLLLLDYTGGTNMIKVLKHSPFFWKWQTRISDIAKYHDEFREKLLKTPIPFKDKISNKDGYYFQYTYTGDRAHLVNLFCKLNKLGLYRSHKPKEADKVTS